ncbi:tyrosine-type recombinase/integrase [Nocardia asiatica]|uniref:tyrosine-type recombinase/integrase n=1 Tax=Nocardia asiatica TaxID=209252 RepID=UPI003EDF67B3
MLYESAARAGEITLDIADLDTANRCATVTRMGGARKVAFWQTGTARLLAGRRSGPLFLTDRKAKPAVVLADIDSSTGRARLSYRRAATLLEEHTEDMKRGPYTLHQLRHSKRTHAAEDGASTPMLMALSGHTSVRRLAKYTRVSAEALGLWQAGTDPAARRQTIEVSRVSSAPSPRISGGGRSTTACRWCRTETAPTEFRSTARVLGSPAPTARCRC